MDGNKVVIAEILRPRGIRGEVLVKPCTDVPERLNSLGKVQVELANKSDVEVEITEAWPFKEGWVMKLADVDSIEQAERFRGADIWVPLADRGQLAEGEYFQSDLLGCSVVESATGKKLGTVDGWQQYGGPILIQMQIEGREVLIPFVTAICQTVDLQSRTITVDLPDGILEL